MKTTDRASHKMSAGRLVAAAVVLVGAGILSAWWTPRGPITTVEVLVSMVVAVGVGLAATLLTRTRWSVLLAPAVFLAVFEVSRLPVDGPTVDAVNLGSTYGIIAFVLGRALYALLILVPMALGAVYGVLFIDRRTEGSRVRRVTSRVLTGLFTVAVIALAVVVARPATTSPVLGPDGGPLAGSVAELITVPIGGHDQSLMIRGRSEDSPVLLYLAGGPGGTDLGAMRADTALEQDFVVVTWEQRGSGKSYSALDPAETLTLDQAISDTIELTGYLRDRFGEDKVYLAGNSWGTILGALAVQRHPEMFHAFVGTGQMVSPRETDIIFYEQTLSWAEERGDSELVSLLHRNGPPPYDDLLGYEPALSHEHDWNSYPEFDGNKEMPTNLFVPENTFMDRINGMRSFLDSFSVLYPQLQEIDLRNDLRKMDVPVYVVMGRHEARGRAMPATEWFEALEAPAKEMVTFEHSGHRPPFEEPGEFASLMKRVRDETYFND